MTAHSIKKQYLLFNEEITPSVWSYFTEWISEIFNWWYVQLPIVYISSLRNVLSRIDNMFGTTTLLKSLATPLYLKDNLVGYLLGFLLRVILIPVGTVFLLSTFFLYLGFILFWALLPILTLLFIFLTPFL